jgi:hypothetical protein
MIALGTSPPNSTGGWFMPFETAKKFIIKIKSLDYDLWLKNER